MPDANEAAKIWNDMLALEREQPGTGENAEAFFKNKEKNMAKLREAYAKATGLPATARATQAIQNKKIVRQITGDKSGNGHETSDTL